MSTMEAEVFDAFKSLGVTDDKASAAAQALSRRDTDFTQVRSDVQLLKWGQGVMTAMLLTILFKLFLH
jgi:hypothetical protein